MSNQNLSRPGALPTWPTAKPLSPSGILTYAHPDGAGFMPFALPLSRAHGAKSGVPINGTSQVAALTYTSPVGGAGAGTITVSLTSVALGRTITATAALANSAAVAVIATAIASALNSALTGNDSAAVTIVASGASVLVTGSATADTTLAIVEVSKTATGVASNTTTGVVVAAAGTVPDYLGQLIVDPATAAVRAATSLRTNTWTLVS